MKINVSSCGRFHSVYLANFLQKNMVLDHFFYAGNPKDKELFNSNSISFHKYLSFIDRLFVKLSFDTFISPSFWYTYRDNFFDHWVSSKLEAKCLSFDIFVGWANCSLNSLIIAKKHGALTIIESGSMHINEQEKILKNEFKACGLVAPLILQKNKDVMILEQKYADFIFVPSEHVKESFVQQGVEEKKLIKVNYGCNIQTFGVSKESLILKAWDKLIFLFVGSLSIQKGIHILLSAWKIVSQDIEAELHLVGQPSAEFKTILTKFNNLKNLFIHPSQPQINLKNIYQKSHILIHPSVQDGLSMVIGEAMASGLVVICSKNSGGGELIENEKTGFILTELNQESLTQKIIWSSKNIDSIKKMSFLVREKSHKYSWENYGSAVLTKYQELLTR